MRKQFIGLALSAMLFALCSSAEAQQTGKIFRIGFLDNSTASGNAVRLEAFRQELNKLGWIEGKIITIEYRFAEQKLERLPELAAHGVLAPNAKLRSKIVPTPAERATTPAADHAPAQRETPRAPARRVDLCQTI